MITAEQLAAAEAEMRAAKESGDAEAKANAMQAFADLRRTWRAQEVLDGRRGAGITAVAEDYTGGGDAPEVTG